MSAEQLDAVLDGDCDGEARVVEERCASVRRRLRDAKRDAGAEEAARISRTRPEAVTSR